MKLYIFICARVQRKNKYTFFNYTFSKVKILFVLLVTHKGKRQSRMLVSLKKTEFAPASVQAGSSSRTFHPEATGGKVQSKKLYPLKRKLLHLHWWWGPSNAGDLGNTEHPAWQNLIGPYLWVK